MATTLLTPLRPSASDAQLARRAAGGDDDAFAALYARYQPRLEAYCRTIVRHDEDARDAAQSAMTKALVAMRGSTSTINVQAWLFRIAHNEAITVLRRRRPTAELSDGDGLHDAALDPAGDVLLREELRATLAGVRALPLRLQQPLLLRELAGMSYREVAQVVGCTSAAARKAVFEARSALSADRAGRHEECSVIRRALSDGDGRRRRARIVRSHLQTCDGCRSWERDLRARCERLLAVFPAAGAAGTAWAWLGGLVGAGSSLAVGTTSLATNAKIAATAIVVVAAGAAPVVTQQHGRDAPSAQRATVAAAAPAAGTPASTTELAASVADRAAAARAQRLQRAAAAVAGRARAAASRATAARTSTARSGTAASLPSSPPSRARRRAAVRDERGREPAAAPEEQLASVLDEPPPRPSGTGDRRPGTGDHSGTGERTGTGDRWPSSEDSVREQRMGSGDRAPRFDGAHDDATATAMGSWSGPRDAG